MRVKKELRIGFITIGLYLVLTQLFSIPDLALGIMLAFGICLTLIGMLPEGMYVKLKQWKKSVIRWK